MRPEHYGEKMKSLQRELRHQINRCTALEQEAENKALYRTTTILLACVVLGLLWYIR